MKYINREYGFTFRPPFFDKFKEESSEGPALTGDNFPRRYIIGAGFDYSAINGAMLIGKNGSLWGVKVTYLHNGKWLENNDFAMNMGVGCANTADGGFAHFSSGPLSLKWLKYNEQGLVLEISARARLRVRVIFYPCYDWPGELSIEGSFVKGRSPHIGVVRGEISLAENNAVYMGRYQAICDSAPEREFFMAQSYNKPMDSANGAFNEAIMDFVINSSQPRVYVYCAVGEGEILGMEVPRIDKIAKLLETAELRYGVNRTMGTGALGQSAENMLNSIMWSKIYYPYLMQTIYSPKRSSLNNHFDINGLEENCAAMLGCYIGDGKLAQAQLEYTPEDKILAALSVWTVYNHLKDKSEISGVYAKLARLYPPDSTLVATKDHTKNEVAYRWTDSPLKELHIEQGMYSLDLSCLKLLAFDILERVALALGKPEAAKYGESKKELRGLINSTFWNDEYGLYMNRYITGHWALYYGATSFYPLIAGAVDTAEKLNKLINNLTDTRKFWGNYDVPTLSKDNKNFGRRGKPNNYGKREPAYLQYRGSIVPYVNYIIYHGLVRYGLDEIAGDLARKSARLWFANDSKNVENFSLYLPTGKRVKQKEYLSNNGNMLALMGIQELIDIEYFRDDLRTALRFGTFVKGEQSLTNIKLLGGAYSIDVNDHQTTLLVNNGSSFLGEGGKFVVRHFLEVEGGCDFLIDAHTPIDLRITLPFMLPAASKSKHSLSVPSGKSRISIRGEKINVKTIEINT